MSMRLPLRSAAILAALACASAVCAVAPEIKDAAKFFSPEAVAKADKEIREIARKYDRDLLVETFPAVPGGQTDRVKSLSVPEREKFFANWAADRAEEAVVNGIYILVCKEPAHLQVIVTEKASGAFNRDAKSQLTKMLLKDFREKHFDEGLQAAVAFVRDRLAANH
jgi:TPM domain